MDRHPLTEFTPPSVPQLTLYTGDSRSLRILRPDLPGCMADFTRLFAARCVVRGSSFGSVFWAALRASIRLREATLIVSHPCLIHTSEKVVSSLVVVLRPRAAHHHRELAAVLDWLVFFSTHLAWSML